MGPYGGLNTRALRGFPGNTQPASRTKKKIDLRNSYAENNFLGTNAMHKYIITPAQSAEKLLVINNLPL